MKTNTRPCTDTIHRLGLVIACILRRAGVNPRRWLAVGSVARRDVGARRMRMTGTRRDARLNRPPQSRGRSAHRPHHGSASCAHSVRTVAGNNTASVAPLAARAWPVRASYRTRIMHSVLLVALTVLTAESVWAQTVPSFGTATVPQQYYTSGIAIPTLTLPETIGDSPLSYSTNFNFPGLTFDPATRTISGTPLWGDRTNHSPVDALCQG